MCARLGAHSSKPLRPLSIEKHHLPSLSSSSAAQIRPIAKLRRWAGLVSVRLSVCGLAFSPPARLSEARALRVAAMVMSDGSCRNAGAQDVSKTLSLVNVRR